MARMSAVRASSSWFSVSRSAFSASSMALSTSPATYAVCEAATSLRARSSASGVNDAERSRATISATQPPRSAS